MKKVVNKTEVAHLFANKSQNEVNNKFISVGCHKITIKEIKKLATNLGW